MNLSFRPATDDDYEYMYALNKATMQAYVEQTFGAWDDDAMRRRFSEYFRPWATRILAIDGRDAGYLEVILEDEEYQEVHLSNIRIAAEYQGQGIGTRLISEVVRDAHARGLPVTLRVLKANPARHLYERLGFVVIGENERQQYEMECRPPSPSEGADG